MKQCLHCGKQLRDDTVTCFFCGKPADTIPEPEKSKSSTILDHYRDIIIVAIILIVLAVYYGIK